MGADAGRPQDVVAVIDTGVDFTHPDLAGSMWVNPGEIPGNGIDDDGNGYIDDIHGIDAADPTRTAPPMDVNGHGTHVAGIIAASAGNRVGVAGVSPGARLLACKFENAEGYLETATAIRCLDYLLDLKSRANHPVNVIVANASWGGGVAESALRDALTRASAAGLLFVAGAGNSGMDLSEGRRFLPADYHLPNIISVGATDASDRRADFSNTGRQRVDVFAPGVSILSTVPGGGYAVYNGTSMAAPHVSGLVALLYAQAPERDWRTVRNLVLSGGQELPALKDLSVTGRRIRAVDVGGVGSMSCENQTVTRRLEPAGEVVKLDWWTPGGSNMVTLSALNIRCGEAAGPITVQVGADLETRVLLDDGQGADLVAGDGIVTAQWTHPGTGPVKVSFPEGDIFTVLPATNRLDVWDAGIYWLPEISEQASFLADVWGDRGPGTWEIQWDTNFTGRFVAEARTRVEAPVEYVSDPIRTQVLFAPHALEARVAAVRIVGTDGVVSPMHQILINYVTEFPSPVVLRANPLVPQVGHPVALDVSFVARLLERPWTLEWDVAYDGETFRSTVSDEVTEIDSSGSWQRALANASRQHVFNTPGVHRLALRVVGANRKPSFIKTWGAEVVCGTPYVERVDVERDGVVEPVTATLRAVAHPGCDAILRYHWDFDADGQFDAVTEESTVVHVYRGNPKEASVQRGRVRVESAAGTFDRDFEVPIQNGAPTIAPIPSQRVTTVDAMTYQVVAADPAGDGDALTYRLEGAPEWVRIAPTGVMTWHAPFGWATGLASVTFEVVVSDDEGATARSPVELVPAYQPPSLPPAQKSGGCSSTGGAAPAALAVLGILLRRKRERAASA
ncbi:S8 family serine peptidase [Myxococcus sp. 1LA]